MKTLASKADADGLVQESRLDYLYPIHDPHLPQSRDQVYRGISGEQFHGSSAS